MLHNLLCLLLSLVSSFRLAEVGQEAVEARYLVPCLARAVAEAVLALWLWFAG